MKIITNGETIAVTDFPFVGAEDIRIPLGAAPKAIGATVQLQRDDDFILVSYTVADFLRAYLDGTTLILTNTPEPTEPSLETLRAAKLGELDAAAQAAITGGCDVTLTDGTTGHISLTAEDQINLSTAQAAVQGGAAGYPYHLDGELCKIYTAADILTMSKAAVAHILYHTTYCNHLRAWAQRATTSDELPAITYGATLPDDLKTNMEAIINAASA